MGIFYEYKITDVVYFVISLRKHFYVNNSAKALEQNIDSVIFKHTQIFLIHLTMGTLACDFHFDVSMWLMFEFLFTQILEGASNSSLKLMVKSTRILRKNFELGWTKLGRISNTILYIGFKEKCGARGQIWKSKLAKKEEFGTKLWCFRKLGWYKSSEFCPTSKTVINFFRWLDIGQFFSLTRRTKLRRNSDVERFSISVVCFQVIISPNSFIIKMKTMSAVPKDTEIRYIISDAWTTFPMVNNCTDNGSSYLTSKTVRNCLFTPEFLLTSFLVLVSN